jgi:hypothetical protein
MTRSAIFRFLANARFFLYGAFVVFSLYIIWLEVLPTNLGESRDRAIHLSLPIVFELSFLAAFLVEKWCRSKLGERANDIPSGEAHRPRALDLVNLVPVIGGCYFAFRGYAPLGICFVVAAVVLPIELLWRSRRRSTISKFVQVTFAALIIVCLFKAQVLSAEKDRLHWSFYLAPLHAVLGGGQMLWDVPSQYGFGVILLPASIAKVFGLDGVDAFGLVAALAAGLTTCSLFYFLTSRVKLSPLVSALTTCALSLFFAGWLPDLKGPIAYPSVSGLRFLPSLLALLCAMKVAKAEDGWTRTWAILMVLACILAFTWSSESFLYTLVPLCFYICLNIVTIFRRSFYSRSLLTEVLLGLSGSLILLCLYSFFNGVPLDILGFYEYATLYASSFGILPIRFDEFTAFYIFSLAFSYFFARLGVNRSVPSSFSGLVFFAFLWIVSTYYVARSHPNNVSNLATWEMLVMALSAGGALTSRQRWQHQTGLILVSIFCLSHFIQSMNGTNTKSVMKRLNSASLWEEPMYPDLRPLIRDWIVARSNANLIILNEVPKHIEVPSTLVNPHGLSPLRHFMILPEARRCEYLRRMIERRGPIQLMVESSAYDEFFGMCKTCQAKISWRSEPDIDGYKVVNIGVLR